MQTIYPVNEIFQTIQGEATFTGSPAVFIRLQGCPVGCGWCDTKHTWTLADGDEEKEFEQILIKEKESPKYYKASAEFLLEFISKTFMARHIVITGGEPCMHDLTDLTAAFIDRGYSVQIETSGTFPIKCHPDTWITLSPKYYMSGGMEVLESAIEQADEIKMPVGKKADVERLINEIPYHVLESKLVFLQPLSMNKRATALCVEEATNMGWEVSFQIHKYLGLR